MPVGRKDYFITYFPEEPPTEDDYSGIGKLSKEAHFMVACYDVCPSTGRLHWHAYMEYRRPVTIEWVKTRLPGCNVGFPKNVDACITYIKDLKHKVCYAEWHKGIEIPKS